MAQPHTDHRLIEALVADDRLGIEEIYRRCARRVRAMVEANSGAATDAQDLFQDVLLEIASQARAGFTLTCPLEPFLLLVCRRRWLNVLRSKKREAVTIRLAEGFAVEKTAPAAADLAQLFFENECRRSVARSAFESLGGGCRELLDLAWSGHFSMSEVAEKLGFTYGYARKKKSECLEKLTAIARALPEFVALQNE